MIKKGECHIGTSGWSYSHWKESFYENRPHKEWFSFYAARFSTVEINATFYGRMSRAALDNWYMSAPPGFRFSLKGNRYITHRRNLQEPGRFLENETSRYGALKEKLAVMLWQLPVSFEAGPDRLENFCTALNDKAAMCRHALEFRHSSWMRGKILDILTRHNIALCISDSGDWPLWEEVSADFAYLRLHGRETYVSSYSRRSLESWAQKIAGWRRRGDVYVYFNNDALGAAPRDAMTLKSLLEGRE